MENSERKNNVTGSICVVCEVRFPKSEARNHPYFSGLNDGDLYEFEDYVGPSKEIDFLIEEMRPEFLEDDDEIRDPHTTKKRKFNLNPPVNDSTAGDDIGIIVNENVQLNINGNAKKNTENYLVLIDLVKEFPIIWNHKLPIQQRDPIARGKAWNQILQNFPGWSKEFMVKKYQSLKDVYMKRRSYVPSGSAQRAQRFWIFDDSFSFLKDVIAPASTISNVPLPSTSDKNNNNPDVLKELGFNPKGKAPIAGSRKKTTPFDEEISKCIETLSTPKQAKYSSCEQFGLYIGKEMEKLDNDYQRMDVQMKIMKVLQDAICR